MKKFILASSLMFIGALLIIGCTSNSAKLGSRKNPIKLFFTPSVDAVTITTNSTVFLDFLEKETGYYFKSQVPNNYIAVVEAFGSDRADVAVMNSFGYILTHQKYNAHAMLTAIRFGETHYKGQIIAHVNSGINKLDDLNGKRFAFTDASSTSGHLFPKKILNEHNIKLNNIVFANKHDNVVTMVYQGQVDAGATYYSPPDANGTPRDARARVLTQFEDVFEKVKIIALTDPIPNDPFVFRHGMPEQVTNKIIAAILKFLETEEGKQIFKTVYNIEGVVKSTDADYNELRKMLEITETNPEELL